MRTEYRSNSATADDIKGHHLRCNATYAPPLDTRVDLAAYASKLAERAETFEAWQGPTLVGLVAAYLNPAADGFITDVSVDPGFTGQGIAASLLRSCITAASKEGVKALMLEVFERNDAALRLYLKLGFEECAHTDRIVKMRLKIERSPRG